MRRSAIGLLVGLLGGVPASAWSQTTWLCGLSADTLRLVCVADAGPQDVHETAPRTVAVVNGTAFPLDPRRQYTVDLHAPAGEMEFVEQLARATMCYRTPACSVAFVGPRADGLVAAVRR